MILLAGIAGFFAVFFYSRTTTDIRIESENVMNRLYGLKDVSLSDQGGGYKKEFDIYFMSAADEFGVPFALLKAHAIKESSINKNAFLDENPKKDPKKQDWGSRGLMQLLWANVKTSWLYNRFLHLGYGGDLIASTNGNILFDPQVNTRLAADLICSNLKACGGNLRDAINMYNTGKKEADIKAPFGYVDKVIEYYTKILGEN